MSAAGPHIVRIDRKKNFKSDTLAPDDIARLEGAFRAVRWWRDRWTDRSFRAAAMEIVRERGGLALVGPGMPFDNPPPFAEFFEPVEIARGFGSETEQLKTISGEKLTREERIGRIVSLLAWPAGIALIVLLLVAYFRGMPARAAIFLAGMAMLITVVMVLVVRLQRLGGRWYLLPGGLAVVRRPVRRGQSPRVTVLSRNDTCLAFRLVSNGKTVMRIMELWTPLRKRLHRSVSEREAISVLAAWQSPQKPPPDERLQELSW
jgi:hypothetical protein